MYRKLDRDFEFFTLQVYIDTVGPRVMLRKWKNLPSSETVNEINEIQGNFGITH